jgi:pyruvate formate lyase activating enzyme
VKIKRKQEGIFMDSEKEFFKTAAMWEPLDKDKKVLCRLCNWRCVIGDGKLGHCAVRKNTGGTLYSLNYYKVISANPDPIEKKPLFHFQPGSRCFSIATMGCNFQCEFCQNWQISQPAVELGRIEGEAISPETIITEAKRNKCKSIAYTYTEPTVFMELCADCGRLAKQEGLSNVFVSNGYMTPEAIDFASDWLDGINIDIKAFNEDFYKKLCKARLQPVLDTVSYIAKKTKIWMEITTLLIPGENDSPEELKKLANFLVTSAGPDIPWHISRFHPQYKYTDNVPTPAESLETAYRIGKAAGLRYVYVGNVFGTELENTTCWNCNHLLVERVGYRIAKNRIKDSKCPNCGSQIAGFEL